MDFELSDDQRAIADLAEQILGDKASHERLRELEKRGGPRFDAELWQAFAEAGLLGIAVPEAQGGAGLGFLELAVILEQIGRRTAPIPFLETALLGVLPLAAFGSTEQKEAWLPGVVRGETRLTAALVADEAVRAERDGEGFRLTGTALFVPAAEFADAVLVAAVCEGAESLFLVETGAVGVSREALVTTSGQPESRLGLEGSPARFRLAGEGCAEWLRERATAALCMLAMGVCEEALELTSEYVKTRKQFDQPIAMFQAVGHRAAAAFIATAAVRLTAWQAAWRLGAGLEAARQVAVAKVWAAEGGKRIVQAAQHLHGGVGVDREYPLHRYYLYARQLELTLGGATPQLLRLGRMLAEESD